MKVDVSYTPIDGLLIIKPQVVQDERGYFFENFQLEEWTKNNLPISFKQENRSSSQLNTLRGLHFQKPPFAQGKLVSVLRGKALDVAVDIRKNSKTYGQHFSILLQENDFTQFYVPPGFAHGFVCLAADTVFSYKCTELYNPAAEGGIMWDDAALGIEWGITNPLLSDKDKFYKPFNEFKTPF
ncbi:MAG: dTDP-4-dehydrorhamnose 3,5-epimerase [Bacteroidetes bacterium]|nr:dTDP-4-dehydrorhamnose 3,5-epimerase [Bacteroidota bacterium]